MNTRIYHIILLLLITILCSCSSKEPQEQEHFEYQYDILHELFFDAPEETQRIEFGKSPEYAQFLLEGWSGLEDTLRWVNARTAKILFYHYDARNDKTLNVTWKSFPSKKKGKQRTEIFLNGQKIKSLTLKPEFKTQSIRLPDSALHFGLNVLTFQFAYTEKPMNVDPNSQDDRDLAAAFQQIVLSGKTTGNEPIWEKVEQQSILQKANTGIGIFRELPVLCEFEVEYESLNGTNASIEILDEQGEKETFTLSAQENRASKTIRLPHNGIYKIHLVAYGKEDGGILWKNVIFKTKEAQEIPKTSSLGFLKPSKTATNKPDFLLYVIDALRADHLGSYGYARNTTPQIDAFAEKNARYQNAYSTSSWTRASGASIFTGLFPRNHHATTRSAKLPEDVVTLAEILQEQGYYTAACITNQVISDHFGFAQGFDEFIFLPEDYESPALHVQSNQVNEKVFEFLEKYRPTEQRKPLFLLIWTTDPHDPYMPPDDAQNLFGIEQYTPIDTSLKLLTQIREQEIKPTNSQIEFMKVRYDQEIWSNDRAFGHLMDTLKALQLYQDMTILLTADHGEEFYEHGGVGHGFTLYNDQIRVPFIIKTPEIEKGVYEQNIQITDIYPTFLDIAGIDEPYPLDGISLVNADYHQRELYFEENLDGNELFARLDDTTKVIFNTQYFRAPSEQTIPVFESFAVDDKAERENLNIESFEDYVRLQELMTYIQGKREYEFQREEAEISPELDQKLRDLGYIK